MEVKIQNRQERIRVALLPIALDSCTDPGLREDEVGEVLQLKVFCVTVEELRRESLQCMVVDFDVRVEKVEVYIYEALLASAGQSRSDPRGSTRYSRCRCRRRRQVLAASVWTWWAVEKFAARLQLI